ncbi:hypothetical protein JRQ81_007946 [Phrynocephalus forsythii]|uniref:Coiled-coil domain containing 117 n=1 Tax=Phrynocephalus forsythii TaxID=171643 RepID=A0A9Q0XD04_9SAUR|nr:hypothetical protein JRQ81_007946 [Phrynocephalus forsythii]
MAALEGSFPGAVGPLPAPIPPGGRPHDGGGALARRRPDPQEPPLQPPPTTTPPPSPHHQGGGGGGGGGPGPGCASSLGLLLPRGCGGRTRIPYSWRKRHKMEEEPEGCPVAKKRLVEEAGLGPSAPSMVDWALCGGQPTTSAPSCLAGPQEAPCEEMEQVTVEPQCEAARRRLQEIEDRIIDEDEEDEQGETEGLPGGSGGSLPTLVLSDTLKTGLKQDYEGDFTKKIIESMSRPSMELVLWRPLPEFLPEPPEPPVAAKSYKVPALAKGGLARPEPPPGPFLPQ